ncbi:hypothetical protein [Hymenobacter terricola]|uniref:hypothetical protein n=1 Tax=Hymenobacter terricola TaxID=2819236 RepID=UPI001B301B95|nr:hypothetical protein [Hymenobacter terricola]
MGKLITPPISLTDATTGKRVRVSGFEAGAMLVARPEPILGYCYQAGHLTVYVNGSMPLALRTAQEDGHTEAEMWLVDELPAGIREIDWSDCRQDFRLLLPEPRKAA